jgi:hypothetical protein
MVVLTGILEFQAIPDAFTAFQMYVGWAFCLPAIYESYVVILSLMPDRSCMMSTAEQPLRPAPGMLRLVGPLLVAIPIFSAMWRNSAPGWLLILSFTGMFLTLEYAGWRRHRTPLLPANLRRDWRPWVAMALASLPYTFLWEGLNGIMGSWVYRRIFWLEPQIMTIPPVAFLGYVFWYVLFLSLLNAVSERDVRVWV